VRGLREDGSEEEALCLRLWGRPLSDTNERTDPAEVQRSRGAPSLRDWEDSIEDTRESGGEPSFEDGAETDLDQGVKKGLINLEENDFLDMGRDWREEEEVDGLRLTTGGRGGGGTGVGVDGMGSVISGQRNSSYWPSS